MKKLFPLCGFLCLVMCISSCKKSDSFDLKGEMQDLTSDIILAIYDDPDSKIDTIYPRNGKFEYTFVPDTLCLIRLADDSGHTIPVFADKGWRVTLKGSFSRPVIEGDGYNQEYQEFLTQIGNAGNPQEQERIAETFIKSHPQSFVSAYLINRYFVQKDQPDEKKIMELINPLDGKVKDSRVLGVVIKSLPDEKRNKKSTDYISYYSVRKRDGKYLSWNNRKGQYTLINFWATWNKKSVELKDSLHQLCKEFKKEELKVLNISLDFDMKAWEKNCENDSEQWIEVCDKEGWNNTIAGQMNIRQIPYNILVNSGRRVEAKNLYGNRLRKKLHELTNKDKK